MYFQLFTGDRILAVDGHDLKNASHDQVKHFFIQRYKIERLSNDIINSFHLRPLMLFVNLGTL